MIPAGFNDGFELNNGLGPYSFHHVQGSCVRHGYVLRDQVASRSSQEEITEWIEFAPAATLCKPAVGEKLGPGLRPRLYIIYIMRSVGWTMRCLNWTTYGLQVTGGTLNQASGFIMRADRVGADTLLRTMIRECLVPGSLGGRSRLAVTMDSSTVPRPSITWPSTGITSTLALSTMGRSRPPTRPTKTVRAAPSRRIARPVWGIAQAPLATAPAAQSWHGMLLDTNASDLHVKHATCIDHRHRPQAGTHIKGLSMMLRSRSILAILAFVAAGAAHADLLDTVKQKKEIVVGAESAVCSLRVSAGMARSLAMAPI